MFFLIKI